MVETQGVPKVRWGELEDEDDYDFLPPPLSIGPDENGVKKLIEYKFNDDGAKVKVTTTTRVRKLAKARLSKKAIERRAWSKFGDAANADPGARHTAVSTEEIILERPRPLGSPSIFVSLFSIFCLSIILFIFFNIPDFGELQNHVQSSSLIIFFLDLFKFPGFISA